MRDQRKRGKQIFSRLRPTVRSLVDLRVKQRASTICQVFEEAIDHAFGDRQAFDAFLPTRYFRQRGEIVAKRKELRPTATAVSTAHYDRFRNLCSGNDRYSGDIVEAMLTMYLAKSGSAQEGAQSLRELLSPLLHVDQAPDFPGSASALTVNAVDSGEMVIIDESVLLCAMLSLDSSSGPMLAQPLSTQAHNLLLRCCSQDVIGMITSTAVARFWKRLWELEFRLDSPLFVSRGERARAEIQMDEVRRRFQLLQQTGFRIIELNWEDFDVAHRFAVGGKLEPVATIACALRQAQYRVAIATATDRYEGIDLGGIAEAVTKAPCNVKERVVWRTIRDIRRTPQAVSTTEPVAVPGKKGHVEFPLDDPRRAKCRAA